MTATTTLPRVKLVAEAKAPPSSLKAEEPAGVSHDNLHEPNADNNFYRSAQWTADGTCIVASTWSNDINTYLLPTNLLQDEDTGHQDSQGSHDSPRHPLPLSVHGQVKLPNASHVIVPAPYFTLQQPTTHTTLVACKDYPIQLYPLFPPSTTSSTPSSSSTPPVSPLASYKLIKKETEAYLQPMSLLWLTPGQYFLCGSDSRLDYFDVTRPGSSGPLMTIPTIPSKRYVAKGGGVGMKGMVSALAASHTTTTSHTTIAAGTRTRWISLYDLALSSSAEATWSIRGAAQKAFGQDALANEGTAVDLNSGSGIMQLVWSPCDRYLLVNERNADGILVYDIRGSREPLSYLKRKTPVNSQRLTLDVYAPSSGAESASGFEVWAGDASGTVSVWTNVAATSSVTDCSWEWKAHDDDSPVGSTALHSSGSVIATCSGAWEPRTMDFETSAELPQEDGHILSTTQCRPGSKLKVWNLQPDTF